jgi:hypothetical protein
MRWLSAGNQLKYPANMHETRCQTLGAGAAVAVGLGTNPTATLKSSD